MFLERIFFTGNQKFFNLFDELAVQITKMSSLFYTDIAKGGNQLRQHTNEMEELERTTAKVIHTLFVELGRNLITPFDREDIHFLATDLNGIARNLLHVSKQIRNYSIDDAVTRTIAEQCDSAIRMLSRILNKLRDAKALASLAHNCADIRLIKYKCDDLLDDAVTTLLNEEMDEFQLIKMMDHYQALQKLLGKIDDVMNVCESIIIKYG